MDELQMVDVSDSENKKETKKKKDKFMLGIYISLAVLIILGLVVYFFGYDILKPYITV